MLQQNNLVNEPLKTNLTELSDSDAQKLLFDSRKLVEIGEQSRVVRLERADDAMRIWKKELWDDSDIAFFRSLGIQPYQFMFHRIYINALLTAQKSRKFKYDILPRDIHSFTRRNQEKIAYVEETVNSGEFQTNTEAEDYFDNYVDDKYAQAITALLGVVRDESGAVNVENDCFENGVITGADFLKAIYSTRNNREGSIDITRVSQRAMIWDESSVEYDLKDIEFIGEVHEMYMDDLLQLYPQHEAQIREHYKQYTNKGNFRTYTGNTGYKDRYRFVDNVTNPRLKLMHLWSLQSEKRYRITDTQTGDLKISQFGQTDETVVEQLKNLILDEYLAQAEQTGDDEILDDIEGLKQQIAQDILDRFVIEEINEPIWYETIFTDTVLFKHKRSELPHGIHPYTAFFAQYTDGYWTSLIDDAKDIIIALSKAAMFREVMLASSAKGLLIVDQNALAASNYTVEDIADSWANMGGVIALKLKAGMTLDRSIQQVTNVAQNLQYINELIRDYQSQLREIIGVNNAQIGKVGSDTPTGRMRMEIEQGQAANGIIFSNFERSLHHFTKKTVTMCAAMLRDKKMNVIRMIGERYQQWVNFDFNENVELFADAVREGLFTLTLIPVEQDAQVNAANSAQLMQLAAAGAMPLEIALKYSSNADRMDIMKDMANHRIKSAREQAASMVDVQTVQQIAMQTGLSPQQVNEFVNKVQLSRYKELSAQENKQSEFGQGMGGIQKQAAEPIRQQNIEQQ